jgi:hypothetical protein
MSAASVLGIFIRPVPELLYCFEVVKVVPRERDDGDQWHCKRWGYDPQTKQPVADGHQDTHYLNNLRDVLPGVWKDEWQAESWRWRCCPLYYRVMQHEAKGQMGLF